MPTFPANPHRFDPYKNFKFRVKWDGKYVAWVSAVSPLRRTREVLIYRTGSDPSWPGPRFLRYQVGGGKAGR
jgi:hypothetical protein